MEFNKEPLRKETHSVRASQVVLQYGVGAMLDFPDQTLMTAAPEFWEESTENIYDERLQKLLGVDCFKIPAGADIYEGEKGISYVRFPEWYFCPRCRKFQPITEWVKEFQEKSKKAESDPFMIKNVKCTSCNQNLVVARIITCCEAGHISDFPWIEWVHYKNMGGQKSICSHPHLKISTSNTSSEGLEGIRIECTSCNARASLAGAFDKEVFEEIDKKLGISKFRCKGMHPWKTPEKEKCSKYPKTMQRGSSSVYFPVTYSSIVIPPYSTRMKDKIRNSKTFKGAQDQIMQISSEDRATLIRISLDGWVNGIANESGLKKSDIQKFLTDKWISGVQEEQDWDKIKYKFEEYDALLGEIKETGVSNDFVIEKMNGDEYGINAISNVSLVHKIKEVQALLGFTRQQPYEVSENTAEDSYISIKKAETKWYPAYEVRGEGIFIEFDDDLIKTWEQSCPEIGKRINDLNSNYANSYYGEMRPRTITSKYVLLHTLSHLLIRELSFESGYSIASIKERIYCSDTVDGKIMSGILLYTASGDSEGTLGGLVRQGRSDFFSVVFKKAIKTALMCSNDPVCILSKGQGRDSLNLAACHSCSLLPETSCEEFNIFLDRGLLVGTLDNKDIGFFRNMLFDRNEWEKKVPVKKEKQTIRKSFLIVKPGVRMAQDINEYVDYILDELETEEEITTLNDLRELLIQNNILDVPNNLVLLRSIDNTVQVDVDLLWIEKKVGLCTNENKEAYKELIDSDWNIFCLNEKFDVDKMIMLLKGE